MKLITKISPNSTPIKLSNCYSGPTCPSVTYDLSFRNDLDYKGTILNILMNLMEYFDDQIIGSEKFRTLRYLFGMSCDFLNCLTKQDSP